jgi:hypothetical protein
LPDKNQEIKYRITIVTVEQFLILNSQFSIPSQQTPPAICNIFLSFRLYYLLMRIVPFVISTVLTIALVFVLNSRWGAIPALGKFLSPQTGFWQSAEAVDDDRNEDLRFPGLKGNVSVYLDDRLVPHVFAQHDEDAYFVQGFLHAKYRLWQMDFNARAAAGRLSEVINNPQLLNYDRLQRRMGMVFAAESMLTEIKKDAFSQRVLDAYTAGINSYISSLTESTLPLEFKLLGYRPEAWSNLKSALFVKLMAADLAGMGYARDLPHTNEKAIFSPTANGFALSRSVRFFQTNHTGRHAVQCTNGNSGKTGNGRLPVLHCRYHC